MSESIESMVSYYQRLKMNPVFIQIENDCVWKEHLKKRKNLYERHLKIPLGLLNNKDILDIGCNSGENSIVLAAHGANVIASDASSLSRLVSKILVPKIAGTLQP